MARLKKIAPMRYIWTFSRSFYCSPKVHQKWSHWQDFHDDVLFSCIHYKRVQTVLKSKSDHIKYHLLCFCIIHYISIYVCWFHQMASPVSHFSNKIQRNNEAVIQDFWTGLYVVFWLFFGNGMLCLVVENHGCLIITK